jgi:iron complex transport system substrate-binding protein
MKTKIVTLLEIAIVICSVFLVAIPGIAADQTMQKVSASEVTTSSGDDFALGVYGNANEDDTIDMRDLTYVKLIFFGKKSETELADAKYDGKINNCYACEALCVFGLEDRIVGVDGFTKKVGEIAELIKDKEEIGEYSCYMDIEKVISLEPDVVIASTYSREYYPEFEEQLSRADIPMLLTDLDEPEKYAKEFRVFGWLMSKQERAEELINFDKELYELIGERVSKIPEDEKPSVAYGVYCPCPPGTIPPVWTIPPEDDCTRTQVYSSEEAPPYLIACSGTGYCNRIVRGGGINAFADMEGYQYVDIEAIIERDPEIFIMDVYPDYAGFVECGYGIDDSSSLEQVRDMFMESTEWKDTTAAQKGDMYMICNSAGGLHSSIYVLYMAKWLHPDGFNDLDPIEIHADWLDEFLGIPYKGVYAYPTPWTST